MAGDDLIGTYESGRPRWGRVRGRVTNSLRAVRGARILSLPLDRYDAAFAVLMALEAAFMLVAVISSPGVLGADIGNYLLTMRQAFGDDPTGMGLQRPPFIAVPLKLATSVLPLVLATKVVAVLVWLFVGISGYWLIKNVSGGGPVGNTVAVASSLGFMMTTRIGVMAVWGFITLMGMTLITVAAVLAIKGSKNRGWKYPVLLGATVALLAATHQVSLFVGLWWLAGYGVVLVALRQKESLAFLARGMVIAVAFGFWLAPLYLSLVAGATGESASLTVRSIDEIFSRVDFFYASPDYALWISLGVLSVIGLVVLATDASRRHIAIVVGSLTVMSVLLVLGPGVWGARALYYAYLPVWALASASMVFIINRILSAGGEGGYLKAVRVGFALAFLVVAGVSLALMHTNFQNAMNRGVAFWRRTDESHLAAASYLDRIAPKDATLIAHPFYSGWWLEGALGRNTYEVGRFASSELQDAQAAVAEQLMSGNHIISNKLIMVGHAFPDRTLGTPQVWITRPNSPTSGRFPQAYLDNGETVVAVVKETGSRLVPLEDLAQRMDVASTADSVSLVNTFMHDDISAIQTTTLREENYTWSVNYSFLDAGEVTEYVNFPVTFTRVMSIQPASDGLGFEIVQTLHGTQVRSEVLFSATNAEILTEFEDGPDEPGGMDVIHVTVVPQSSEFDVTMDVAVQGSVDNTLAAIGAAGEDGESSDSGVAYARARDLAEEHSIDYAYISSLTPFVTNRLNEAPAFEVLRLEDHIHVYRITADGFNTADMVEADTSPEQDGELVFLKDFTSIQHWRGFRSENIRKLNGEILGESAEIVATEIVVEPERWSGLIFDGPSIRDWSELKRVSMTMRWGSLEGFDRFAIALEDAEDDRWAWYRTSEDFESGEGEWQVWDLLRQNATRQDENFEWHKISEVHISALASADSAPRTVPLEVGPIWGVDQIGLPLPSASDR